MSGRSHTRPRRRPGPVSRATRRVHRPPSWPAVAAALVAGPALTLAVLLVLHALAPTPAAPVGPTPVAAQEGPSAAQTQASQGDKVRRPRRVQIPGIGVDARLEPVGLQADGAMEVPSTGNAGWYRLGPRPGAPGPAVLVAHVDSRQGPDVFYRLRELRAGDAVTVTDRRGTARAFVVTGGEQVPKDQLPAERIWADSGRPQLRLITCGGTFDRSIGHYRDNTIVYAQPL